MKTYLQVSKQWLIDRDTMKFVPLTKKSNPCIVEVPPLFWEAVELEYQVVSGFENVGGVPTNIYSTFKKADSIQLNNLDIRLLKGYQDVVISFKTFKSGSWSHISLKASPNNVIAQNRKNGQKSWKAVGMDFSLDVNGDQRSEHIDYRLGAKFNHVQGLHHMQIEPMKFSYGLLPRQYEVSYNGNLLGGKSLAFICGPWVLLLDDDLTFDTLAYLKGVSAQRLDIAKFSYTINTYVLKVMTMM